MEWGALVMAYGLDIFSVDIGTESLGTVLIAPQSILLALAIHQLSKV